MLTNQNLNFLRTFIVNRRTEINSTWVYLNVRRVRCYCKLQCSRDIQDIVLSQVSIPLTSFFEMTLVWEYLRPCNLTTIVHIKFTQIYGKTDKKLISIHIYMKIYKHLHMAIVDCQ